MANVGEEDQNQSQSQKSQTQESEDATSSEITKVDSDKNPTTTTVGKSKCKSSSPVPSPDSSDGRRGRSRTRGTPHATPKKKKNEHDRQGYHSLMSSFGKIFHVEKRWKLIREMGSGAYGFVISAQDEISSEPVAIKMVTRVFEKVQLAKRALREITLLRHFSHENITGLIDVDCSPTMDEMYYLFLIADLHQIIKSGQALTNEHVQYFVYQILRGLKYIHSASVVHRDLKPGNLLVNADCELKICDFGLSRGFDSSPEHQTVMTEYVATRWYRAPEIMLAYRSYNTAIDIWSVGCILAELLLGRPLFKGKDYVDQLNKILEVLGTPEDNVIKAIGSDKAQAYVRSLPIKRAIPFEKLLPAADIQAVDLLKQLVTFDPSARLVAPDALAHPWLSSYHEEEDEPNCIRPFDRWRELESLETLEEYREALVKEIEDCRREVRSSGHMGSDQSPSVSYVENPLEDLREEPEEDVKEEEEEEAGDQLTAMQSPSHIRSPAISERHLADRSPVPPPRRGSREQERTTSTVTSPSHEPSLLPTTSRPPSQTPQQTDPVVAYARRSSMFLPSRTNSTYSVHRVPVPQQEPTETSPPGASTIAFPSAAPPPEYVFPARTRTASTIGYSSGRRRLLRTLSTVSVYETGQGHAGGLADIAPIGKYIVERDRTGEDNLKSEMPRELGEEGSESHEAQLSIAGKDHNNSKDNNTVVASGSGEVLVGERKTEVTVERKKRFIID
ncbi:kinase-like domain-containing protein [Abortiporus biennis]|nr:kinase-like domain-containing protein [Abortiporus biennis]